MSQFLLTNLITMFVVVVNGLQFDMNTLTLTTLKFLGDAHLTNNTIRLSKDLGVPNSGAGRVFYSIPIPFRKTESLFPSSFSTFFSFSITDLNPSSIGGGLTFFITPDDESLGGAGGFLGLGGSGGLSEFLAVEFDTLMDLEFRDLNGNHVGIDLNGMVSVQAADLGVSGIELKSGDSINAWIEFDGITQILNVSVSYSNLKPKFPILSYELESTHFNDFMFAGFSGSTQGSTEIHCIEYWNFTSFFPSNPNHSVSAPPPSLANLVVPSATLSNSTKPLFITSSNSTSSSCRKQLCKEGAGVVAGVVTAGAFCLAFCTAAVIWIVFTKRVKKSDSLNSNVVQIPKFFRYKDLKAATKCFDSNMIIGHGAVGVVYRGVMPVTGDIIAVKRCNHYSHGKNEFLSELSIIRNLRHRNLIKLQGWCHEKDEILLVYDLMPNGSLDKALYENSTRILSWQNRRKILIGVASALAYLHQECEEQVIHRDVKTSNIMLDEDFEARLGDFGLAKQVEHDRSPEAVTVAAGTMGYLAPEYLLTGIASEKTDVFSYGAVVLEVVSGRRPIDKDTIGVDKFGEGSNLMERVWSLHRDGKLLNAADRRLGLEFDEDEMMRVLLVGLACSNPDPSARPTMRAVVQMLIGEIDVPNVPRFRPTLSLLSNSDLLMSLQDSVSECDEDVSASSCSLGREWRHWWR